MYMDADYKKLMVEFAVQVEEVPKTSWANPAGCGYRIVGNGGYVFCAWSLKDICVGDLIVLRPHKRVWTEFDVVED